MKFFIKQSTGTDALFTIIDTLGQSVYRVTGDSLAIGSKFYFIDGSANEAAKIVSLGLTASSKYTIFIHDKECARVNRSFTSQHHPVKIRGVKWHFRGDLMERSYDLINEDSAVVMTHGRCWNENGDCFAVDITNESDVLLCLCIAVILDSTVIGGSAKAVPAN
ncbi:LURP-one-related family protein [Caproiciproducens galactitolivorans]|mgnify:CR=1 FL=1|uniref:LURP-one-related family protein n=1 Tax=Caproiciproducens galactitolivorans TaxID=642589 RepID=A0ABT4BSM5_9FIRM|nr:LURP-one-related family protein [Caproiciproducens galactitolivorans]MCY1712946.1 LURP-one-related family protein [Caproiciproducens galactitolivorans]